MKCNGMKDHCVFLALLYRGKKKNKRKEKEDKGPTKQLSLTLSCRHLTGVTCRGGSWRAGLEVEPWKVAVLGDVVRGMGIISWGFLMISAIFTTPRRPQRRREGIPDESVEESLCFSKSSLRRLW